MAFEGKCVGRVVKSPVMKTLVVLLLFIPVFGAEKAFGIYDGETARDELRYSVVKILKPGTTGFSGVQIGKRSVLTAAHAVVRSSKPNEVRSEAAGNNQSCGRYMYGMKRVSDVIVFPSKKNSTSLDSNGNRVEYPDVDLAIVKTSEDLCGNTLPLAEALPAAESEVVVAGHGQGNRGDLPNSLRMTFLGGALEKIADMFFYWGPSAKSRFLEKESPYVESRFFMRPVRGTPCFGDSGGPVFVEEGGQVRLLGIMSANYEDQRNGDSRCKYAFVMKAVSVLAPEVRKWIEENSRD